MIYLFTRQANLRKMVAECVAGYDRLIVSDKPTKELPRTAHYVVATTSLSSALETFCAARGAMPVILPEAADYISEQAQRANMHGLSIVIIGADHRMNRL